MSERAQVAAKAATDYSKSEKRGKPSVTKRAAGGAVKGAAAGASVGSVVPGVGTAAGAAVGGVLGAGLGAKEAKDEKRAMRSGATRGLIAEFTICIVILALSPMSNPEGKTSPVDWMKRGSAMCGLFLLLGLVSSIGPRAGRAAVAFGGLVTLALVIDQRSIFGVIASRMSTTGTGALHQPGPEDDEEGDDGSAGGVGKIPRSGSAGGVGKVERYVEA